MKIQVYQIMYILKILEQRYGHSNPDLCNASTVLDLGIHHASVRKRRHVKIVPKHFMGNVNVQQSA